MLEYIDINLKNKFRKTFRHLLDTEPILKHLLLNVFVYGTAYVVGGYFRDFLNKKNSRDIDIIVDLENIKLLEIISNLNIPHTTNRHGGIKLQLKNIDVDLWSLENNWAFKNKLVKLNENYKLTSIAKGCFFNYDSLVINLHNYSYNTQYYNEFRKTNILDILQKSSMYKNLNPTVEANIIRAYYLKQKFNVVFSKNLTNYIVNKVLFLSDQYTNGIDRLIEIKSNYPKYNDLLDSHLRCEIRQTIDKSRSASDNLFLDFK